MRFAMQDDVSCEQARVTTGGEDNLASAVGESPLLVGWTTGVQGGTVHEDPHPLAVCECTLIMDATGDPDLKRTT